MGTSISIDGLVGKSGWEDDSENHYCSLSSLLSLVFDDLRYCYGDLQHRLVAL